MKKSLFPLLIIAALLAHTVFASDGYFLKHPTLTPDGSKIVFSYDSDLWIVEAEGGTAYRITAMDGEETMPRISPDGKRLAFTGSQSGDNNVYVMPITGGEIKQLTFNDSGDSVDSWSWDSGYIYFTSSRYNNFTTFMVSRVGGTPIRVFEIFFNTIHDLIEHPKTKAYFFTDTWESSTFANRKRYKGDYNPDIKSYDPVTREFKVHTKWRGKDFQPTIDKNGNIFFISDEANGEYNLYRFKNDQKTQLTKYDRSIFNPQISASGNRVVFEKDYSLYIYDTVTATVSQPEIKLHRNNKLTIEQDFNVSGKITNFNISPDGKKIAFISRGELFVSDIKGKFIHQLATDPMGRVMEAVWLKDNRTLLFTQTSNGWQNLYTIQADGNGKEKRLTDDTANNRNIELNHDSTKAAYLSGRNELRLLDLKTYKSKTVARDELWGLYNPMPRFSPDGLYLAYTAYRHFERDIFILNLESGKSVNITGSGVTETEPFWSPDGKYLYFTADRSTPVYPTGYNNAKIYRLPLIKIDQYFRSDEFDKLFKKEEKKDKDDKKKEEKPTPPVVKIDFKKMALRWERISPKTGIQFSPYVINQKDETTVLYISNHDGNKNNLWKTVLKPFETPKTTKIVGAETGGITLSTAKDKYYILVKGAIQTLNLKENKIKPVKMKYLFRRNLRAEFTQMFYEAWANMQENYYDDKFHGVDWEKMRNIYASYLPRVQSRSDLRRLLSDMLGELNSSHQGFYSNGDEEKTYHKMKTMQPGIIFHQTRPYIVDHILKNSASDVEKINIRKGDQLIAVNGRRIEPSINREFYFTSPEKSAEYILTFKRGEKKFDIKLHPATARSFKSSLYDEWIENNQHRVDNKSKKRIAYVYMKDMVDGEFDKFIIDMTTEWYNRDALILDLRYNRGGNVHDAVLNFLAQRPYTLWKYRGGKYAPQPNFAPAAKPIVLLINEQSLSDAEMTAAGFKTLKLGKIIGTETYRWIIFTSGKGLVDGSFYRLPSWGCYTLEKEDLEMNGVKPDIYIKTTFKDRLDGKDPQLDRAIKEIMKQLK